MQWKDVDLKTGRLTLHEGEKVQARSFTLSEKSIKALKGIDAVSEYAFTTLEGRPLRKETLVRELRLLKRQLGIAKDWVFRDLRHSFAVNFLKAGSAMTDLQKIMGHYHVQMTKELYGQYQVGNAELFEVEPV